LGIPVIVAPCSALPSVVGDCGTIAKSHKTKDLAEAIIYVMEHPTKTEEKRLKAVEKAKQWTWGNTAISLTEFICSVL
jgi:glycosyltransferase involved in cell wall biosynthesis